MTVRASLVVQIFLCCLCLLPAGCASIQPQRFAGTTPHFDPVAYFTGPTHSWGVVESRSGDPKSGFRTAMRGVRDGDGLAITQDFTYADGHAQQRVWHIKQIDAHRFDATANDVVGVATGYAYGNTFRWDYTLQVKAGNPLTRVHMKHWMRLTDDGDLMINRVIISKFGIVVAETTEYFRRGADGLPTGSAAR